MNDQNHSSSWRRRLLIAWFSLGWVVALVLALVKSTPFEAARAQGATQPAPTKGPYSPIGLTYDSCNTQKVPVKMIAKPYNSAINTIPNYIYIETIHHVADFNDLIDNVDHPYANDTDVMIYIEGTQSTSC